MFAALTLPAGVEPFGPASFDTITIIASLNHIPERREVLAESHRLLQPGGRLILTMIPPGISRFWHKLRAPFDPDQRERGMKDGEVYGLTRQEVRRLVREAGFRVVLEKRFMLGINLMTVAEKAAGTHDSRGDGPLP